jgi:AraC-like DNA-binding protein
MQDVNIGFRYREYPKGCVISRKSTYAHFILFVLRGSVRLNCNGFDPKIIQSGEMVFIVIQSFVDIECLEHTIALVSIFGNEVINCDNLSWQHLKPYAEHVDYNMNTLKINSQLKRYLDLLVVYLRSGAGCSRLHQIKLDELFLCLRFYYSKEQLASFFYPIIGQSMDFRIFFFANIDRVKDIRQLISLSNMGKSAFYERFKAEFGESSPKKWLDKYFESKILFACSQPGITVKELAYSLDFDSESSFSQYCRRHFDRTPSELIKSRNESRSDW